MDLKRWMKRALRLAQLAKMVGEVPVGAIILSPKGKLLASGYNRKEQSRNPLLHAEVVAIERATRKLKTWRLEGCILVTTLEPCVMCSGAIIQARFAEVYFGAVDPKGGGLKSLYEIGSDPRLNHRLKVCECISDAECSNILTQFFKMKRK